MRNEFVRALIVAMLLLISFGCGSGGIDNGVSNQSVTSGQNGEDGSIRDGHGPIHP